MKNFLPQQDDKQQLIDFFQAFSSFLKNTVKISNSSKKIIQNEKYTPFDLKKSAKCVSLDNFLQRVFSFFKCSFSTFTCALCLMDRFLEAKDIQNLGTTLTMSNIYKIVSISLLLATKNFDDFYYTNSYYARVCGLGIQELNDLQKKFLQIIDFNVFVDADQFNIYDSIIQTYKEATLTKNNIIGEKNNEYKMENSQDKNEDLFVEKIVVEAVYV